MRNFWLIISALIFVFITNCKKFPDIGKGYKLDYNSLGDIAILNSKNSYLIYGHILEYAYDSVFIIVAERPRDSIPECTGTIPGMTAKKCNEAFKKSTFCQYWIIDKSKESVFDETTGKFSNVYGPYKHDVYLRKKKELGIPDNLKLKSE